MMSSWPSVHTEYWLRALTERGHEVHFLFPLKQKTDFTQLPEGVTLHQFTWEPKLRGTGSVAMALELRRHLRRIAPDIFHIHSVFAVRDWRLFLWALAMCSFHPLVLTAWGGDLLNTPQSSRAGRLFVKYAVRSADLITADSQSLLDAAASLGAAKERLHEVQFGVDTVMMRPDVETDLMRAELDLGAGPIVYSPRAFMPVYNQLCIVEALPLVLQSYPDCRFVFKRRSDHHSPETEAQVQRKIEDLGLAHAVRIVPDLPYERLAAMYALSDVVVSVPDFDGTPRSVLEAMACGAYPVVSDVAALREWIVEPENGLFVRAIEPKEISEAIVGALADKERLAQARLLNRKVIEERASSNYWVTQMEALYSKLIS
jgi:glycosyltransferase involved in cell wall biosynthesis